MLEPNTILQNRYLIIRKLGQGGMGAIYEAIDQRVNCVVALKQTLYASSPQTREAFRREAALLANLRHASLPKVMDYFSEGNGEFLVMEFIAGHDLLELLALRGGPLAQVPVLTWTIELLKLLEHLHSQEPPILHRDIKPANLKLTSSGEIFLLDFGLAKGATGQMPTVDTDRSLPGYTRIYSPLEQILVQGTDQRSDLYALGATLYHLLTGRPPISAPIRFSAIEENQPDPLKAANQINVDVAPEVAACIQNAMALSRKDRTRTARDMRFELEQALKKIDDRDIAHQAEKDLLKELPTLPSEGDPARPLVVDENVQFTVYAPEKIKPEKNYSLLAFAHLSKRRNDAAPDELDPIEEVKKQAARVLGDQLDEYREAKDWGEQTVPRGGELRLVPVVKGLMFNPPSRSFTWQKSVHREEFDVRASAAVDGQTLTGSMTVFLGNIVIADVRLSISVDSHASLAQEKISLDHARSARRVRQVFASYSRRDEPVVAELAQVAPLFGSRFLLDRTHLEPGEDRMEGLQRLIREADVFQLFWSNNSMRSAEIADEIRYAVGLGRPGFILPTYWEEPVPRSPAEGLPPPEIDRLQFYRIYPSAISRTVNASVVTLPRPQEAAVSSPSPAILSSHRPAIVVCVMCGMQYYEDMRFCARCGSTLQKPDTIGSSPQSTVQYAPQAATQSAPQTGALGPPPAANYGATPPIKAKRRRILPIAAAAAAMVLLVMVVAPVLLLMNTRKPGSSSTIPNRPTNTNRLSNSENVNSDVEIAPTAKFLIITGDTQRLGDFRGRVVVLNFWSTSSIPSRDEIPTLNDLQKKYGARGVSVIGLSKSDSLEQVKQFQKEIPQDYVVGLSGGEIETKLPATGLPTTYIIDRAGRVKKRLIGRQSLESYEAAIEPLLNEP